MLFVSSSNMFFIVLNVSSGHSSPPSRKKRPKHHFMETRLFPIPLTPQRDVPVISKDSFQNMLQNLPVSFSSQNQRNRHKSPSLPHIPSASIRKLVFYFYTPAQRYGIIRKNKILTHKSFKKNNKTNTTGHTSPAFPHRESADDDSMKACYIETEEVSTAP